MKELSGEAEFYAEHTLQVENPEPSEFPEPPFHSCIDWENAPGGERQCDDEEPCEYHDTRPQFFSAAIYHVEQAYGGPEEGGWYYLTGEPELRDTDIAVLMRPFPTRKAAWDYANSVLREQCAQMNRGLRPISSVLSTGVFEPRVERGFPAEFPKHRPHYE